MRMPLGDRDDLSPATVFLLTEMEISSKIFSILDPVRPCGRRSHNKRWLSVPVGTGVKMQIWKYAANTNFGTDMHRQKAGWGLLTLEEANSAEPQVTKNQVKAL